MPDSNWNTIAEAAYEAYSQVARADAQTLSVPEWENLGPRMQEAWREAVQEACRLFTAGAL
jgi:hypothetical protein